MNITIEDAVPYRGKTPVFDPEANEINIYKAFAEAGGIYSGLHKYPLSVPHDREPEISFLLDRMELAHSIYDMLAASRDIVIVPNSEAIGTRHLLSMSLDTVDQDENPTRLVDKAGYAKRKRLSVEFDDGVHFTNFDHSVKTKRKDEKRKEWECHGLGLDCAGEHLVKECPTLPLIFSQIDPDSYRISGNCLAARGTYKMLHLLPESKAVILYDDCNDACLMATPRFDRPVDYRRESEIEGKKIYKKNLAADDYQTQHDLIDQSLHILRKRILDLSPGEITLAHESKLGHAQRAVGQYFAEPLGQTCDEGIDFALRQSVRPEHFATKTLQHNLSQLAIRLPDAQFLLPSQRLPNYNRYFDPNRLGQHLGVRSGERRLALVS